MIVCPMQSFQMSNHFYEASKINKIDPILLIWPVSHPI